METKGDNTLYLVKENRARSEPGRAITLSEFGPKKIWTSGRAYALFILKKLSSNLAWAQLDQSKPSFDSG